MNFKLAYISTGIWYVVGTDLTVARWLSDDSSQWMAEAEWGTETEDWLIRNGLDQAATSSRAELLEWITVAAEGDPLPKVTDGSRSVKFVPGVYDGVDGYVDITETFFVQRHPCSEGRMTWWLNPRYEDLPGGSWYTNSRTLRGIRQHIYRYYQFCGEIGESAQAIADAKAAQRVSAV